MTAPDPALVERVLSTWDSVYEGQCEIGSPHWTDNREAAMAAAVEAVLAALRESGRLVEWRPVAEAPTDGRQVLAGFQGQWSWVPFVAYAHPHPYGVHHPAYAKPTHWADLPAPPATAATEGNDG